MNFIMKNESFLCEKCHKMISKHPTGSARNHCPYCLYSLHVDDVFPWDRASLCHNLMQPIDIEYKKNKWWMIQHQCVKCQKLILNKIAPDDDFLTFSQKIAKKK